MLLTSLVAAALLAFQSTLVFASESGVLLITISRDARIQSDGTVPTPAGVETKYKIDLNDTFFAQFKNAQNSQSMGSLQLL